MGYVEWQSHDVPINGGWPYCHGPNANYNDWDYETLTGATGSTAPARP